jgi:hypothetical protein
VALLSLGIVTSGLFGLPRTTGHYHPFPSGVWEEVGATSPSEGILVFGILWFEARHTDIAIFVYENDTEVGKLYLNQRMEMSPQEMDWLNGPAGAEAMLFDDYYAYGYIDRGDYVKLSGLRPGTQYSFVLFHIPYDSGVTMTGAAAKFVTP